MSTSSKRIGLQKYVFCVIAILLHQYQNFVAGLMNHSPVKNEAITYYCIDLFELSY